MGQPVNTPNDAPSICDYEGSTYRTDFWEGQGREYEHLAEHKALLRLLPAKGHRLLDIGAGFGRLAPLYRDFDEVVLLDYSRSQLEYARERLGDRRFRYVAADIYRLPIATNAVDTTVMVRVLHHLVDVPLAFQQIARVLAPQGSFILEFANKRHIKNLLRYPLRRGPNPFDHQPYEFTSLHYDFHPTWVRQQLTAADMSPQQNLSVSLFRMGWLKRHISPGFLADLDALLQAPTASLTLGPSVFVRSQQAKAGAPEVADTARLFRCPACGYEPLDERSTYVECAACGERWAIENGVYLFK